MANPNLLNAALAYARLGWAVLPLHSPTGKGGACSCSLGKDCGRNTGKHPRTARGHIDATTNEQQIRQWWRQWPDANVGIRTGAASGLLVLDIDPRNGGDETLEKYIEDNGPLPKSPSVKTGSNGRHYFYTFVPATKSIPLQGGIDIKSDGGYVVAPPSRHYSGGDYKWLKTPKEVKLGPPPEWVVKEQRSRARTPLLPNRKISEGERHTFLVKLAGWYRRVGHHSDFIFQALSDHNVQYCEPPLLSEEVNKIAYSADDWEGGPDLILAREMNDMGNGLRFGDRNGRDVRHLASHGPVVWTGNHWDIRDELNLAQELAKLTVDGMLNEIRPDWDPERSEKLRKWQITSGNEPRLRAMMKLGFSDPRIAMRFEDFDTDPWLLNVFNGTIDLRSGKLQPHAREDYITKLSPVWFNPEATCPTWMAHLNRIMEGNEELIGYLQRLLGYCLTGQVTESIFPIFWGSGQNGKSTLLRAVRNVLGTDYVNTAPSGFLMSKTREEHPTEIADLAGSRIVIASETGKGARLNVEQMKQLTGEDRLKGRYMRMDYFEFPVTFKVIYMTNHKPIINNTEIATWRRIKLIPFTAQIPPEERDNLIDEKLRSESSGILNWMLEGCRTWQNYGMMEPEEVSTATKEYRTDSDVLGEFINEELEFGESRRVSVDRLYGAYEDWAKVDAGLQRTYSKRGFGQALRERDEWRGVAQYASKNRRMWRGVGLRVDREAVEAVRKSEKSL